MALKREFQKKDVTRIRNIARGKAGDKTIDLVGYNAKKEFHKEGDIWEDLEGKKWTIIDGEKESYVKAMDLKSSLKTPLFCPNCETIMNKTHDSTYYNIHKMCFNCVITLESNLKREGKWEEYETKIHNDEIDSKIEGFKMYMKDKVQESKETYMSENGDIEKWVGDLNEEMYEKNTKEVIEYLVKLKR